ncbi:hypothetical protein AAG906_037879 [Vitis piasezkii]
MDLANCIASLWKNHTYDRLKLHLPKQFCQLPYFPFPDNFPEYPTKVQFIDYLESYAKHFEITPRFNESVQSAKWLVVATGENAEKVVPEFEGLQDFGGSLSRKACTGSGLWKFWHGGLSGPLQPQSNSINGGSELGERPSMGPLKLKNTQGKTPVLDIGALERIRSGEIRVVPGIKRFSRGRVEFVNGENLEMDCVILATGYCSNDNDFFSEDGLPKTPFPNGWKGRAGLYAVGFTKRPPCNLLLVSTHGLATTTKTLHFLPKSPSLFLHCCLLELGWCTLPYALVLQAPRSDIPMGRRLYQVDIYLNIAVTKMHKNMGPHCDMLIRELYQVYVHFDITVTKKYKNMGCPPLYSPPHFHTAHSFLF